MADISVGTGLCDFTCYGRHAPMQPAPDSRSRRGGKTTVPLGEGGKGIGRWALGRQV